MDPAILIRDEAPTDVEAISEVTAAAFKTLAISGHTEQFIIVALRQAGALTVSIVAALNGRVIGHVACSPVTVSDGTPGWYGLGPIAVLPEHQRTGVGTALMQAALGRLQAMNARGCCLVGHPEYYQRFGFARPGALRVEGVPSEVFFARAFAGAMPSGVVAFHEAFQAPANVQPGTAG